MTLEELDKLIDAIREPSREETEEWLKQIFIASCKYRARRTVKLARERKIKKARNSIRTPFFRDCKIKVKNK